MRQKGAARLRALELELACVPEAEVPDETTGDVAKVPAKYDFGIQRIMAACEEMVGRSATDRKGELRERYCLTLKRGNSESVTNFALRYRTLVAEMKAEGIQIDEGEQSWFYRQKLLLSKMQKQMLETTLGAATENYMECEKESIRLFKRIHNVGGFARPGGRPSNFGRRTPSLTSSTLSRFRRSFPPLSASSSTSSTWRRGGGRPMQSVHVTETEEHEAEHGGEDEVQPEVHETSNEPADEDFDDDGELQGLQSVLEVMAAELDEVAEAGGDEEELQGIEDWVEEAVEALVT